MTKVTFSFLRILITSTLIFVPLSVESFSIPSTQLCECEPSCPCPDGSVSAIKSTATTTAFQTATQSAKEAHNLRTPSITPRSKISTSYPTPFSRVAQQVPTSPMDRFHFILKQNSNGRRSSSSFDNDVVQRLLEWNNEIQQNSEGSPQKVQNSNKQKTIYWNNFKTSIGSYISTFPWTVGVSLVALLSIGTISTLSPNLLPIPTVATTTTAIQEFIPSSALPFIPTSTVQIVKIARHRVIPSALAALKQMIILEFWRKLWLFTFRSFHRLYQTVFGTPYSNSLWWRYAPTFIRVGVRRMSVKVLERKLKGLLGSLWSWGLSWFYFGARSKVSGIIGLEEDLIEDLTSRITGNDVVGDVLVAAY